MFESVKRSPQGMQIVVLPIILNGSMKRKRGVAKEFPTYSNFRGIQLMCVQRQCVTTLPGHRIMRGGQQ